MAKINLLSEEVSNKIAAGEVVERPASAVKEMIENSIDAGAGAITIEIKNGGISFIRVTDNGEGMDKSDAERCFLRHATSKLKTEEDLQSIATMGFRGEALAAIAAVSKIELLTRKKDSVAGTRIAIDGGEIKEIGDAGCPEGTTIVLRDIFYNVPARQKFLKKDITEAAAISAVVDHAALGSPEISFRYIKDGKSVLITQGGGLSEVVREIFGREILAKMAEVNYENKGIKVSGYVSLPEHARPNRALQYFFLNGRYIKGRVLTYALEEALKNSIMVEKYPLCVLNIEIIPSAVDINVHPAKTEAKFSDEKAVYDAVYFAVKNALFGTERRPEFTVSKNKFTIPKSEIPSFEAKQVYMNMVSGAASEKNAAQSASAVQPMPAIQSAPAEIAAAPAHTKDADGFYRSHPNGYGFREESTAAPISFAQNVAGAKDGAAQNSPHISAESPTESPAAAPQSASAESPLTVPAGAPPIVTEEGYAEALALSEEAANAGKAENLASNRENSEEISFRYVGELFNLYILVELESEVLLIDKHAAQERIRFEKLKKTERQFACQSLLNPAVIALSKEEHAVALDNLETLEELGFMLEDFGTGKVIMRTVPMDIAPEKGEETLIEICGLIAKNKREITPALYDDIYHSIACKASVKGGNDTPKEDLESLARQILKMPDIRYCPHGRPVAMVLKKTEIDKEFKRI